MALIRNYLIAFITGFSLTIFIRKLEEIFFSYCATHECGINEISIQSVIYDITPIFSVIIALLVVMTLDKYDRRQKK